MTITLTPEEKAIAQWGADKLHASRPNEGLHTPEEWLAIAAQAELDATAAAMQAEQMAALAANDTMVQLGIDIQAATPDKAAAALAAARAALT